MSVTCLFVATGFYNPNKAEAEKVKPRLDRFRGKCEEPRGRSHEQVAEVREDEEIGSRGSEGR